MWASVAGTPCVCSSFGKKPRLPLDTSVGQKIMVGLRAQETEPKLILAMCPG
jgi:hypothetical protein